MDLATVLALGEMLDRRPAAVVPEAVAAVMAKVGYGALARREGAEMPCS